jgi:hypothetical protein
MLRDYLSRWTLAAILSAVALALTASAATADKGKDDKGNKVEGTITAVDVSKKTITITRRNGTAVTLNVTAATKAEIDDRDVAPSALLKKALVGKRAEATFNAATKNALKVEVGTDD